MSDGPDPVLKELFAEDERVFTAARAVMRRVVEETTDPLVCGLLAYWTDVDGATDEEKVFFALHAALWRVGLQGKISERLMELVRADGRF